MHPCASCGWHKEEGKGTPIWASEKRNTLGPSSPGKPVSQQGVSQKGVRRVITCKRSMGMNEICGHWHRRRHDTLEAHISSVLPTKLWNLQGFAGLVSECHRDGRGVPDNCGSYRVLRESQP